MLLIDCYNLLHAPMPPGLAGLDEARLCELLSRGQLEGGAAVVVCDGTGPKLSRYGPGRTPDSDKHPPHPGKTNTGRTTAADSLYGLGRTYESQGQGSACTLIYSGKNRSADDVIIELIDKDSAPRSLIVVSDDRQIQKAARRRRAKVCSCQEFISQLQTAQADSRKRTRGRPASSEKAGDVILPETEVRKWAREFGVDVDR